MGFNEDDKYFCKDTELQNFHSCVFAFKGKTCIQDIFENIPHVTVRTKIIKRDTSVDFYFI